MSKDLSNERSENPIDAKLINFLIEKTKDAKLPIACKYLAGEAINTIGASMAVKTMEKRIRDIRSKILYLEDLDTETKVKLLFVLSAPVDVESIGSKIKGIFRFDEKHRITYYKSINGALELEGDHTQRGKQGVKGFRKSIGDYLANRGKPNNGNPSNRNIVKPETKKFIDLIFEKCKNISSPLVHFQMLIEFNTLKGLIINDLDESKSITGAFSKRIRVYCEVIQNSKSLDTHTKVRQLFGLGASLTENFLEKLRQNACVKVDNRNRIIEYTSKDGSLYLVGKQDPMSKHHQTATAKSRRRSVPTGSDDVELEEDSIKMHPEDLEKWSANPINAKLIQFLIEKTKDARCPISIKKLAAEFRHKLDYSESCGSLVRIRTLRQNIYHLQRINMETKVKLLFALSVPVDEELIQSNIKGTFRFDDKKRIIYYESIDGKLKLEGDHNSRKKEGVPENFQISRELIKEFFANREKSINGQLPKESENEREVWKFIGFVFEKCKNISSPLILAQFYDEYNALYRLTKCRSGLETRIKVYCKEIQNMKSLDTRTKVRQLFGLSASLTEDCLEELRRNALVRVDNLKRIIEYKSNDESLLLQGKHDLSSKTIANRNTNRRSNRRPVERPIESDDEDSEEDQSFDEDSDDGVVSDDENYLISSEDDEDSDKEENGDTSEKSVTVQDKKKRLSRRRISSSDDSDSNDHQSTSTAIQTSRCGRLLKNRDLDAHLSQGEIKEPVLPEEAQAPKNSSVSDANTPIRTNNKRKTINTTAESSKRSKESTTSRTDDLEDYDPNHSFNDSNSMANDREHVVVNDREAARLDGEQVKVEVFRGALQDEVITIGDEDDDDIQEIPPPPNKVNEVPPKDDVEIKRINTSEHPRPVIPLKQEQKELVEVKKEAIVEEVEAKPVLSSNRCSVLQVLQALRTLVISLDCPSFESLQKEIEEKMKNFEGSGTSIPNVEVALAMELCFSKMNGSSFISSSESSSFIKLRDFLCYFKSFILNLKIEELKSVMEKVNGCMKDCQNKIVRVKKVAKILQVTLDLFTI